MVDSAWCYVACTEHPYFAILIQRRDLPAWFLTSLDKVHPDLQSLIVVFEAVAQLVLLECHCAPLTKTGDVGWLALQEECDNFRCCLGKSQGLVPQGAVGFSGAVSRATVSACVDSGFPSARCLGYGGSPLVGF